MNSKNIFIFALLIFCLCLPFAWTQGLDFDDEEEVEPQEKPEIVVGSGLDEEIAIKDAMEKLAWKKIEANMDRREYHREKDRLTKFVKENVEKYMTVKKKGKYSPTKEAIKVVLLMDWKKFYADVKYVSTVPTKRQSIIIEWHDRSKDFTHDQTLVSTAVNTVRDVFQKYYTVKVYTSFNDAIRKQAALDNVDPQVEWKKLELKLLHGANLRGTLSGTLRSSFDRGMSCNRWYAKMTLEFKNLISQNTMTAEFDSANASSAQEKNVAARGIGDAQAKIKIIEYTSRTVARMMLKKIRDEIDESEIKSNYFKVSFHGLDDEQRTQLVSMIRKLGRQGVWKVHKSEELEGIVEAELEYARGEGLDEYILTKFKSFKIKKERSGPGYIKFVAAASSGDDF